MALQGFIEDFEVFLRERGAAWNPSIDVAAGSSFDQQVIQPVLRRIGSDPFSTDVETFLLDLLASQFPELAVNEGDALTDTMIKPLRLFLEPLVRENARLKRGLSFRDPSVLTTEEADALGANLFSTRETGDLARGYVRVFYASPQNAKVSASNPAVSRTGLRFFPDATQSIRADEMALNRSGSLYYFDVNVVAEAAGEEYNLGVDEIVSIRNLPAATRVTNPRRFRFGVAAETAAEFVARAENDLTERSLVTDRGIQATLPRAFPEITRLMTVGMGDAEMTRDVLRGGGLGHALAGGAGASPVADGEARARTRRVDVDPAESPDFTIVVGTPGTSVSGWVLTLFGGLPAGAAPRIRDYPVRAVVGPNTLDLVDQLLEVGPPVAWTLRRRTLELGEIPGGLLFPSGPTGTVEIESDAVHIGGATDIHLRGVDLDSSSIVVDTIDDERPALEGVSGTLFAIPTDQFTLLDLVLGVDYEVGDATWVAIDRAPGRSALRIPTGLVAGTYEILASQQTLGSSPTLVLRDGPAIGVSVTDLRWRLLDAIDIDLLEPKVVRLDGTDAKTVLGSSTISTGAALNLATYGVAAGDTLRLLSGPDANDYEILAVTGLFSTDVTVDRALSSSHSDLAFEIFRGAATGGVVRPLVRVTSVDLLDATGQPIGVKVPYARPLEALTGGFANTGNGVKIDVDDAALGVVGDVALAASTTTIDTRSLLIRVDVTGDNPLVGGTVVTVLFTGAALTRAAIIARINAVAGYTLATLTADNRLGLLPSATGSTSVVAGENDPVVLLALFGSTTYQSTSRWIRSATVTALLSGWLAASIVPPIEAVLDVAQVLEGYQVGFYARPVAAAAYLAVDYDFSPEAGRRVQVGSRSLGTARLYFLEPTSVEIGPETRFYATLDSGARIGFLPDPTNAAVKIPAGPNGAKPRDGRALSASIWQSPSIRFISKGVLAGDELEIDFLPLIGTIALADPVPALHGLNLVVSAESGVDQTITLVHDSASIAATSVTRQGIADQINAQFGRKVAKISATNHLELEAEFALTLRTTGTANAALGFGIAADLRNDSPNRGVLFTVASLAPLLPTQFTVTPASLATALSGPIATYSDINRQQFRVRRPATQRISVSEMAKNLAEAELYYWDVQLVSEGTGDQYNLAARVDLSVEGYRSDGYDIVTDDPALSFSTLERPRLVVSRTILPLGVDDDLSNALQLSGGSLQVAYERTALVASAQSFVSAPTERVINESVLVRHLLPYFVRLDLTYAGTLREEDAVTAVNALVSAVPPDEGLEASAIEKTLLDAGATYVENPIELLAVAHAADRRISLVRSQNRIATTRLAAFIPDVVTASRKTGNTR